MKEAREMRLPNPIGSFKELFTQMNNEIREGVLEMVMLVMR